MFALAGVSARAGDLRDGLAERVTFCFSRPVRAVGPSDRLVLLGPDVDTEVAAVEVDLLVSDARCVLAGFRPGTPVTRYTVALAERGAVFDLDGASVTSTVPMAGAPPRVAVNSGGTSSPDLVAVRLDRTLGRIAFVYDEPLDENALLDPRSFFYARRSGSVRTSDAVVGIAANTVVVRFVDPDLEDAVRAGVLHGGVRGRDGEASPAGVKVLRQGETTAPELLAVVRAPGSEVLFDFTFDRPVDTAVASRFVLYRDDATRLPGTAVVRPDPSTVRVLIRAAEGARPVLAAAAPSAVAALGSGHSSGSALGIVRLDAYGATAGRTTGPDLLTARVDPDGATLRLLFDQPLDRASAVDMAQVYLVLPGGRVVGSDTLVQVRGRELLLLVEPGAAGAAQRVVVRRGAVVGRNGEASASGSRLLQR